LALSIQGENMKRLFGPLMIVLALSITSEAFAAQTTGEWWEVSQKMEMAGMPDFSSMMPGGGISKVCMGSAQEKQPFSAGEDTKDCVVSNVKSSGNTTTFDMKCNGDNAMTGSGEITRTDNSFSQKMKMQSSDGELMLVSTGKRVGGACSVKVESSQLQAEADKGTALGNKLKAEAAANTIKFCAVETKTIDPQILALGAKYFDFGSGSNMNESPCKTEQSTYCTQVRKVAGMPAGYRKYDEIKRAFADNPDLAAGMYYFDPVKTCKIDPAPLLPNACRVAKKELSTNNPWDSDDKVWRKAIVDWGFMTNYCSADAEAYYKKVCVKWQNDASDKTGRFDWCNVERDWKSTGEKPAAQAVKPQPQKESSSEVVEQSKTKAVTEGVTKGVNEGMNLLKGFFK
jgi:hypothetical protein